MAKRKHTSKPQPSPNRTASKPQAKSPSPEALAEAIEEERLRLMKARSMLICIGAAMEEGGSADDGPYYPALIEVAGDLVNESIQRLDSET